MPKPNRDKYVLGKIVLLNQKDKKKLLIIGCARSGTFFSAEIWRKLGLDIQHERDKRIDGSVGKDGFASWFLTAEDPYPPFGPSASEVDFDLIFHQVRHPLKVIPSTAQYILQYGIYSPGFIEKHLPNIPLSPEESELNSKQQLLLKAARYWYYWNLMAEKKASQTIQVEEMEKNLPRFCEILNVQYKPEFIKNVSKKTNSRIYFIEEEPWDLSWRELEKLDSTLTEKIKNLASLYGYKISE
jgi:hypothetical protein